eukprot:scaffold15817_cov70-Phaeocystis_antarctica.AAC.2
MPASRAMHALGTLGRAIGFDAGVASAGQFASCSRTAAAAAHTEVACESTGPAVESRGGPASRASRSRSSAARAVSALESRSNKMAPTFLAYAPAASGEIESPSCRKVSRRTCRIPAAGCSSSQCANCRARSSASSATSDASPRPTASSALARPMRANTAASSIRSVVCTSRAQREPPLSSVVPAPTIR